MRTHIRSLVVSFTLVLLLAAVTGAQQGYKKPPKEVLDILNAPVTPGVSISPTRDNMLLTTALRYPPLADIAQPMLRLAGRRINPASNSPHRLQYSVGLTLKRIAGDRSIVVIEHDMDFVSRIAKKVTVLHLGKKLAEGTMDEIHNNRTVQDVYLGH